MFLFLPVKKPIGLLNMTIVVWNRKRLAVSVYRSRRRAAWRLLAYAKLRGLLAILLSDDTGGGRIACPKQMHIIARSKSVPIFVGEGLVPPANKRPPPRKRQPRNLCRGRRLDVPKTNAYHRTNGKPEKRDEQARPLQTNAHRKTSLRGHR